MAIIDKKTLEHLAELARIEIEAPTPKRDRGPDQSVGKEAKLLADLKKILEHFNELKELDTKDAEPMAGGTWEVNVFREDIPERTSDTGKGKSQFPEVEKGYLKVPPVFEI